LLSVSLPASTLLQYSFIWTCVRFPSRKAESEGGVFSAIGGMFRIWMVVLGTVCLRQLDDSSRARVQKVAAIVAMKKKKKKPNKKKKKKIAK